MDKKKAMLAYAAEEYSEREKERERGKGRPRKKKQRKDPTSKVTSLSVSLMQEPPLIGGAAHTHTPTHSTLRSLPGRNLNSKAG